jgi:hypothetical protein
MKITQNRCNGSVHSVKFLYNMNKDTWNWSANYCKDLGEGMNYEPWGFELILFMVQYSLLFFPSLFVSVRWHGYTFLCICSHAYGLRAWHVKEKDTCSSNPLSSSHREEICQTIICCFISGDGFVGLYPLELFYMQVKIKFNLTTNLISYTYF